LGVLVLVEGVRNYIVSSPYLKKVDKDKLPRHIAIIMDGNGRWANQRFMPRTMGHRAGMASLKKVVRACSNLGIKVLTVYAFSTENWKRPSGEVNYLMDLLVEYLHKELDELHENNVIIRVSGDISVIPEKCRLEIKRALNKTENNSGMIFNLALNYGARHEIIRAVKKLTEKAIKKEIDLEDITEESFADLLYTGGLPDPDLLIRTAGEMRLSNFLLWQIAYTEFVVTDTLWPDFSEEDLYKSIIQFQQRDRKFGGLSENNKERAGK